MVDMESCSTAIPYGQAGEDIMPDHVDHSLYMKFHKCTVLFITI